MNCVLFLLRELSCHQRAGLFVMGLSLLLATGHEGRVQAQDQKPAASTWAHIELKGPYPEAAPMPGVFGAALENLATGIARLDKAAQDPEVAGVVLRINSPSIGWARLHEFREAIARIRGTGRKVLAVVDDAATHDYLLASACDEILMPESGSVMMLGVRAEITFYRNLFETVGIKADMMQVGEYKGAAEPYTRTEMSPAFREEMEAVLDSYFDQIVTMVARDRSLPREKVIAAIDNGPHTARAAKELGLIDRVAYDDEVQDIVTGLGGKKLVRKYGTKKIDTDFSGLAGMMKMMNLMMGIEPATRKSGKPVIAVIYASGVIMPGPSISDLLGGEVVGSDTMIKAIQRVEADPDVKAIVLRIDSPGGSALASDLIWRALKKCRKPVVASMGDTAASGGYYIAMGAQTVFAEPGTLTGSIGVVGGKLAVGGLFDKVGVTTSVIQRGKNAGVNSLTTAFSETERDAMRKLMQEIYSQFTSKVAEARKLDAATVEKLARGRVYTGLMAKELKLVDEMGTLDDAIRKAKELAGLKPEDTVERLNLPRTGSPLEALFGPIDLETRTPVLPSSAIQSLRSLSPRLASELSAASVLRLMEQERRLTLLPFRLTVE